MKFSGSSLSPGVPSGNVSYNAIGEDFGIVMVGPVARIAEGQIADEMFQ